MGFGIRLKDILKQKGISIKELSQITGISLNTLYSITKRDTQIPSKEIIDKIVIALDIKESELLSLDMISRDIRNHLDNVKQTENDLRQKLCAIAEMLNADALGELLNSAIDMLQDDVNRSIFYKKNKPTEP